MPSKLYKLCNVSKIQLNTYVKCVYALINQLICITNKECLILHHEAFRAVFNSRGTKIGAPSAARILIQVRYLKMHSKRRYKVCICSVILGELESFIGFSIIFPKILDAISRFAKVRIFLFPLSVTFLNPKILCFLYSTKIAQHG